MIVDVHSTPYASRYRVLLDGEPMRYAVRADDEAGTVEVAVPAGFGNWASETRRGKVEIIRPDPMPPRSLLSEPDRYHLLPGDHLTSYVAAASIGADAEFAWVIGGRKLALRGDPDHLRQFAASILHQLGVL